MTENIEENLSDELLASPEVKLKWLNDCLFRLYAEAFSQPFLNKLDFEKKLLPLLRRTVTAQLLAEKRFVAITGAQGAGKSTFVKNFLGLEEGVLVTNSGRGERFPLFITQTNSSEFERVIKYISNKSNEPIIADRILENTSEGLNEWENIQKGKDSTVLLAELRIPRSTLSQFAKDIFDQVHGIMLLPGYVLPDDAKDPQYFITLMRDSLTQADHAVVVTTHSDLANRITIEILNDLQTRLPGVKPVVAVSSSEFISKEDRISLTREICSRFELTVPDQENSEERWSPVIFSPHEEGSEALAQELGNALQATYHPNLEVLRTRQLNSLYELLQKIQKLLQEMSVFVGESRVLNPGSALEKMSNEYSEFNLSISKLRTEYSASLKNVLRRREKIAIKIARSEYGKEYEGLVNKVKSQIRSASREIEKYESLLERACFTAMHEEEAFGIEHAKFVEKITEQRLRNLGAFELLGKTFSDDESDSRLLQDLDSLITAQGNLHSNSEISSEYLIAVRALPIVVMMVSDTFWSTSTCAWKQSSSELDTEDFLETIADFDSLAERLEHMSDAQKKVLTAIGSILFVDVAADGTLNSIPALAHGIHALIYGSASTGTAAGGATAAAGGATAAGISVAGVVAISVAAVLVAKAMHSSIKLADRKQIKTVELNIVRIFEAYLEAYLNAFDDMMGHLRDFYLMQLNKRYHLDSEVIKQIRLDKKLADAQLVVDEMLLEVPPNISLNK